MMKTKLLQGLGLAGLALLAIGCGPPPGPDKPSFAKDVKPIMVAHCVRCHGAGGTLNKDPATTGDYKDKAPASSFLDSYDDPPAPCKTPTGTVCQGAKVAAASFSTYLKMLPDNLRMPPLPADKLSDVQVDLILRWAVDKAP
jgi:mono/diheme cytochrome c family protein